jgi:hypothetical protein
VKLVLAVVYCCVSIAAAVGQELPSSVDQSQHVLAGDSYVSDQQNLLNSQGFMELLRTDHRSVLRVDNRTSARKIGETQAARRSVPLSSSGIVRVNSESRLTRNRPFADVSNSDSTTALDFTDLPERDSDAFPIRRPLSSELCCGAAPARSSFGIVWSRSRRPMPLTSPLERYPYGMSALRRAPQEKRPGSETKPSTEGSYGMSALSETTQGKRPGSEAEPPPQGFGKHIQTPSFLRHFEPQQARAPRQFVPPDAAMWSPKRQP